MEKQKTLGFFSSPECFFRIKQPQNLVDIFFQPFFETAQKLYVLLMYGIV